MKNNMINYLKRHPRLMSFIWTLGRSLITIWNCFIQENEKQIIFSSFGGRKFDDSPKRIYEEICSREQFDDYKLIWAFTNPDEFQIKRGEKVKIDTILFFKLLLQSRIWVSNTIIDRGFNLKFKNKIRVETWHGTPIKKIAGDENTKYASENNGKHKKKNIDSRTIRCAQSSYDRDIFSRLFNASKESILLCDLPRNDELFEYSETDCIQIKKSIGIPLDKKIILYTPTYREFLLNSNDKKSIIPPIDIARWKKEIGKEYILLFRLHYAVSDALDIGDDSFVFDVSKYPNLNDLFIISDLMISDYSSTFFDYGILGRPMLCFAYDLEEYTQKRGLYRKLEEILPCEIHLCEDTILESLKKIDVDKESQKTKEFHQLYTPYAGNAGKRVVDEIERRINL
ncbi:MAG: hypothetical protein E7254_07325 [Lachnospiraceae bacterium]|nr:hypothetical protein [Lachnospiraceae bacterium]